MSPFDSIASPSADCDATNPKTRLIQGDLARLWLAEVPKVVARHEEERRRIRQSLGLLVAGSDSDASGLGFSGSSAEN